MPWPSILESILGENRRALSWGFLEPWIQTEVFAALDALAEANGWDPFPMELPYVTFGPVSLPKPNGRDWRVEGAVKWIDLCLRSRRGNHWLWVEFKARHAGLGERRKKAALEARNAVRKDVVALLALDPNRTADLWSKPDWSTNAYWIAEALSPLSDDLRAGSHSFATVYLQLGGPLVNEIWREDELERTVRDWWQTRVATVASPPEYRRFVSLEQNQLLDNHQILTISGDL